MVDNLKALQYPLGLVKKKLYIYYSLFIQIAAIDDLFPKSSPSHSDFCNILLFPSTHASLEIIVRTDVETESR